MDGNARMTSGILCFFLIASFLTGIIDGCNADECSEDTIKDINDLSELLFTRLQASKPTFTALDDTLSGICKNALFRSFAGNFFDKLSKCPPDILGKTQLVTMSYGPLAFVHGFEKEISKGLEYFCGCSPYLMSGMVMNALGRKSAFEIKDIGMFQFISNISAYCAEINDETLGKISIPSVVRKVLNSREVCPEVLRLAGLNSSKIQSFLTDFIENCGNYSSRDFQCALEKSQPASFTTCVSKYASEMDPCRKARCVHRKIQLYCGGRSGEYYYAAVNLLNGKEGFNTTGCTDFPEINCATNEKIAEVTEKIDMRKGLSRLVNGFGNLKGLLSESCKNESISGKIKKYVDIYRKCPDLVGRVKLTNLTFGFLKFGETFEKLATKGYQYFCDCSPFLLSTLVLNGLKDLQTIRRATGVFPTIANVSFYCDEIHDATLGTFNISSMFRTVLSGEGKCPGILSLAEIKSDESASAITRVLDQCSKYKPDEFACTLDPTAMAMVKECKDNMGDERNTCRFYNCVVPKLTKKCGSNGAKNYVSAVNVVSGHLTFNVDGCESPSDSPSSSIQLSYSGFLILYVIAALQFLP